MNAVTLIAGALLNSFWQAVTLAFLVWLAVKLLQPRVNAATRHIIWWLSLAALVMLPLLPHHAPSARATPPRPQAITVALPVRIAAPLMAPLGPAAVTVPKKRASTWPYWLLAIWAAVFADRTARILRSYLHLRGVKRRATAWERPLPGVSRAAHLLVSSEVSSPIAVGFLHPAVILPVQLREELTAGEMNCVLLHESAHLARYDDWTNLLARALGAALMLHPVAWWILRQIEREREITCDDWVVAQTGAARSYAESLARIVELKMQPADAVLATGIFTRRSRLRARIEMLLRRGREFSPVAAWRPVALATLSLIALTVASALAPHWIAFAQKLEFEVASVKRVTGPSREMDGWPRRSGDLIMMHNTQPYSMIYYAYHLHGAYQMVGYVRFVPDDWNWFSVDARVGRDATDDEVRLMFQSLLEDRFKLKVHRETRDITEYEVTIAKGKASLTPASDGPMTVTIEGRSLPVREGTCGTTLWTGGSHITCHAVTMAQIVAEVGGLLRSPIVDRTGLTGKYDLNLRYMPDDRKLEENQEPVPSLTDALRAELGLKLDKGKGPVEVLVIDHMEKPSEN